MERKRERKYKKSGREGDEGALYPGRPVNIFDQRERCESHGLTVETSHKRIDLSSEPEASVLLSGDQAIVEMPARWPSSVCRCLPVAVSQILIVASAAGIVS